MSKPTIERQEENGELIYILRVPKSWIMEKEDYECEIASWIMKMIFERNDHASRE